MTAPGYWFDPLVDQTTWADPEFSPGAWFDAETLGVISGDGAISSTAVVLASGTGCLEGAGAIASLVTVLGIGDFSAIASVQPSGGFGYGYDRELRRRSAIRAKQRKLDEETAALSQPIDREIGLLLREQEAKDQKRQELERLRELANDLTAEQARRDYGERVAKALDRAIQQANYSALAALDREIQRAQEEDEQVALAVMMLIDDE